MNEPTPPIQEQPIFIPSANLDMDGKDFYTALHKDYDTLCLLHLENKLSGKLKQYKNNLFGFLKTYDTGLDKIDILSHKMRSKHLSKVKDYEIKLQLANQELLHVGFEIRDKYSNFTENMKSRHSHFFPKDH